MEGQLKWLMDTTLFHIGACFILSTLLLGLLGLATSLPPMLALLMGWLHLDVRGMSAVLLLQSIWNLAVGFWLRQAGTPSVAGSTPSVAPSQGEFKE